MAEIRPSICNLVRWLQFCLQNANNLAKGRGFLVRYCCRFDKKLKIQKIQKMGPNMPWYAWCGQLRPNVAWPNMAKKLAYAIENPWSMSIICAIILIIFVFCCVAFWHILRVILPSFEMFCALFCPENIFPPIFKYYVNFWKTLSIGWISII